MNLGLTTVYQWQLNSGPRSIRASTTNGLRSGGGLPHSLTVTWRKGGAVKTRVVVVDDDRAVRELPRRLVEDLGCEPVLAGSGAEALEILGASRWM